MKKTKKAIALILSVLMAGTVMTACSSTDSASSGSEGSGSESSASSDTSGTTSESLNYGEGLDENGFFDGVKALDYVKLCDYKNIKIASADYTPSDDDIQSQLDSMLSAKSTEKQITDRAVEDGDTLNIDYVGSVDGVEFDGGSTGGAGTEVTIGVTNYIDGFLDQLVGHKPGESFDINVTFPDDYGNEALNGKAAVFAITINYIVEKETPELTDEFVSSNYAESNNWKTVSDMKLGVKEQLQTKLVSTYIGNYLNDNCTVSSIPDTVATFQENSMINSYKSYASSYGLSLEDFLKSYAGVDSVDALKENNADSLKSQANSSLIIQAIAEDSNLTVTDDDVKAYFKENFSTEDYSSYETTYGMPYIKLIVLSQMVNDNLAESATLE